MLKVHTQKLGMVTILHLKGRIMIGETKVLRNAVLSLCNASVIVLDLMRVTGVDAHGLGVLLELREQIQSKGVELRLMTVTRLVRQVLEATRLNTVFEVSSETEVLSRASRVETATPVFTQA